MSSTRPYPPSAQRLADARAHGHVPRAPMVHVGATALALITGGAWAIAALRDRLRDLAVGPLEALARGDRAHAFALVYTLTREVLVDLSAWLGAAWGLAMVAGFAVQGVTLGWPKRGVQFPSLAPSRTAALLWIACLVLCAGLGAYEAVDAPRDALPRLIGTCAQHVFALTLPCMVVDAAFARARFRASLWLTRRELRDEQRAAFGSPLVRAARARLVRERENGAPR
ncbi:MAG: EscU/YscU/HrcU family type III secretion system export apparatus switch protein [Polyangiales bacterium]